MGSDSVTGCTPGCGWKCEMQMDLRYSGAGVGVKLTNLGVGLDVADGLQGSSAHGIFQARVLEWGAIAFSKLTYLEEAKSGNHVKGAPSWEHDQAAS